MSVVAALLSLSISSLSFAGQSCPSGKTQKEVLSNVEWQEFQVDSSCRKHGTFKLYKENRLRLKGTYLKNLRSGEFHVYHRDGHLVEKRVFDNGKLNGISTRYYKIGAKLPREEVSYKNGLRHGITRFYSPTGVLLSKVNYSEGRVHGKKVEYTLDQKSQLVADLVSYYRDGLLLSVESLPTRTTLFKHQPRNSSIIEKGFSNVPFSKVIMASFSLEDILLRERLSVLLPSDVCVPEITGGENRHTKQTLFVARDNKSLICFKSHVVNDATTYNLYNKDGYLRERGHMTRFKRTGDVEFYKDGRLIYTREFENGLPRPSVKVYADSKVLFSELVARLKPVASVSTRNGPFFSRFGQSLIVDGRASCKKALLQREYYFSDPFEQIDGKSKADFLEETCREGCARSCFAFAHHSYELRLDFIQSACNLGLETACKQVKRIEEQPEGSAAVSGKFEKSCFVDYRNDCADDKTFSTFQKVSLACVSGDRSACQTRKRETDIQSMDYVRKCSVAESSDWCETQALRVKKKGHVELFSKMVIELCKENLRPRCSLYAKYVASDKQKAFDYGCQQNDMQSCFELGKLFEKVRDYEQAIKVYSRACNSVRADKVKTIDLDILSSSRACKKAASLYSRKGASDTAESYFCLGNLKMGYVRDCSQIKVLSRKQETKNPLL